MANVKRLSVVALLRDLPEYGLVQGQVGTVGEVLQPGLFEVDFRDRSGTMYLSAVVSSDDVTSLHREREQLLGTLEVAAGRR
jgi:hypothetical protein